MNENTTFDGRKYWIDIYKRWGILMEEEKEWTALDYINAIEPDHARRSCEEGESYNAAFTIGGLLYNKCNRCTLFAIMQLGETTK